MTPTPIWYVPDWVFYRALPTPPEPPAKLDASNWWVGHIGDVGRFRFYLFGPFHIILFGSCAVASVLGFLYLLVTDPMQAIYIINNNGEAILLLVFLLGVLVWFAKVWQNRARRLYKP